MLIHGPSVDDKYLVMMAYAAQAFDRSRYSRSISYSPAHILLCNLLCFATFATRLAPGYDKPRLSFLHGTIPPLQWDEPLHGNRWWDATLIICRRCCWWFCGFWILTWARADRAQVTYPSFYIHLVNLYVHNGYIFSFKQMLICLNNRDSPRNGTYATKELVQEFLNKVHLYEPAAERKKNWPLSTRLGNRMADHQMIMIMSLVE